jgi:hypothetical protein
MVRCIVCVVVICGLTPPALAQTPTVLQRATDPLTYVPKTPPTDRCRYSPCPSPDVILDRITGALAPSREFRRQQNIRVAVVNLNPFIHFSHVDIVVRRLSPNAPGDFLRPRPPVVVVAPPPPPPPPPRDLPPCNIPPEQRARLRLSSARVQAAGTQVSKWLQDSLVAPRRAVTERTEQLRYSLHNELTTAEDLFRSAWHYNALVTMYVPAVRESRLSDSARFVPLARYHDSFRAEVLSITGCQDSELSNWQILVQRTDNLLDDSRRTVGSTEAFLRMIESDSRSFWSRASIPGNFYIVRGAGGYPSPSNVFVRLYLFSLESQLPNLQNLPADRADASWTLVFR